jgi:hypothetical protein
VGRNHHGLSTGVAVAIVIVATCLAVIVLISLYFKVFRKKNIKGNGESILLLTFSVVCTIYKVQHASYYSLLLLCLHGSFLKKMGNFN